MTVRFRTPEAPSDAPSDRRPATAGFSLIEVLAAVAILGIVLGAALRVQRMGLDALDRADWTGRAMVVADAVLAPLLAREPAVGAWAGEQDGFQWRIAVRPLNHPDFSGATRTGFEPLAILVTVGSADGRRYELRSVRLGRRS